MCNSVIMFMTSANLNYIIIYNRLVYLYTSITEKIYPLT